MPKVTHSVTVNAPLQRLWKLLSDGVSDPGSFLPYVDKVEILERQPGSVLRRLRTPDYDVVERITLFEKRHEIDFMLEDHAHYAGQSRQVIEELYETDSPGLSLTLTLSVDWRRTDREDDELNLDDSIRAAAERLKSLAEQQTA